MHPITSIRTAGFQPPLPPALSSEPARDVY